MSEFSYDGTDFYLLPSAPRVERRHLTVTIRPRMAVSDEQWRSVSRAIAQAVADAMQQHGRVLGPKDHSGTTTDERTTTTP